MKTHRILVLSFLIFTLIGFNVGNINAQAISPEKSARALAISDGAFINRNIRDNQLQINFSQKALERATETRIKELAELMVEDHSAMLYSLQELKAAGSGSSTTQENTEEASDSSAIRAAKFDGQLSLVSGGEFDSLWVANMLIMHQQKFDELTAALNNVRNPQLKMAITEALPKIRKHRDQLSNIQKALAKMAVKKKKVPVKK